MEAFSETQELTKCCISVIVILGFNNFVTNVTNDTEISYSGESMNRKATKVTVCAVAAAMLLSGSQYHTADAAPTVAAFLPAAGLGLVLDEGTSIAKIREDVKKKKAAKEEEKKRQQKLLMSAGERETKEPGSDRLSSAAESSEIFESATDDKKETETVLPTKVPVTEEAESTEEKTAENSTAEETSKETESADRETESKKEEETGSRETESESETTEPEIVEAVEPEIKEPETKISEEEEKKEEKKETLIIAQVNDYVNIRNTPGTEGEVVGKLYNNSVGTLLSSKDGWYKMKSGNVEGYVKAEYFKSGSEAKKIADEVGNKVATVNTETLKVRKEASLDASVLGLVPGGEELTVTDEENGFVKVSIEEGDGWVSADYVDVETEYVTAESVEEEKARLEKEEKAKEEARKAAQAAEEKLRAEEKKREEEKKAEEQKKEEAESGEDSEDSGSEEASSAEEVKEEDAAVQEPAKEEPVKEEAKKEVSAPSLSSGGSLGSAVANYATQFVGNPYVYGGTSLTNGADCSGFVMSVYKNFGVSLPHSSSADRHVGYHVGSLSEAQPGDLVCYSGHVGIYIGGGQIVHASTEKTGIKISDASYRSPVAIRRIF